MVPPQGVVAVARQQASKARRGWVKHRNRRSKARAQRQGGDSRPRMDHCSATGKVRYRSEQEAVRILAHAVSSKSERRREQRFYRCSHCRGYHLTSQPYRSK